MVMRLELAAVGALREAYVRVGGSLLRRTPRVQVGGRFALGIVSFGSGRSQKISFHSSRR